MIRKFEATIEGVSLLMHNGQLSDPLNSYVKEMRKITSKPAKKKGDADHEELGRLEFQGGLWFDDDGLGPIIPGDAITAMIVEGARKTRRGKEFEASVYADEQVGYPLEYKGPRTRDGLWADPAFRDRRGAGVKGSRVTRTRPRFRDWSVTFRLVVTSDSINENDVHEALVDAGKLVGLGDWRPRHGTFSVKEFKAVAG